MILALDFDGVLPLEFVPGTRPGVVRLNCDLFGNVPRFETVLRDFPSVDIIISSTWRLRHSLDALRARFSPDIARRIIGVTPLLPKDTPSRRQAEIHKWLRDNGRLGEPVVAVDDFPLLFDSAAPWLLWVDPRTGFDDKAARELR